MSQPQSSAATATAPDSQPILTDPSEAKLLESLQRLDDLHNRLIGLRTVIPKILHPLTSDYATPVEMFEDFSSRVLACSEEIATFNTLYSSSAAIFELASATRAQDPTGIHRLGIGDMFLPPEQVTGNEDEGRVKDEGKNEIKQDVEAKDPDTKEEGKAEEIVENTKYEDIEDVLEEFEGRLMHRDVDFDKSPGGTLTKKSLKVVLPPPSSLLFTVEITPSVDNSRAFIVTSVRSARHPDALVQNLHTGILRAVTARQWPGNLEILLEMLAAYKSLFSAKCDKCKRLTAGAKGELPVVRKMVREAPGKEKRWIALHEGCQ